MCLLNSKVATREEEEDVSTSVSSYSGSYPKYTCFLLLLSHYMHHYDV